MWNTWKNRENACLCLIWMYTNWLVLWKLGLPYHIMQIVQDKFAYSCSEWFDCSEDRSCIYWNGLEDLCSVYTVAITLFEGTGSGVRVMFRMIEGFVVILSVGRT